MFSVSVMLLIASFCSDLSRKKYPIVVSRNENGCIVRVEFENNKRLFSLLMMNLEEIFVFSNVVPILPT